MRPGWAVALGTIPASMFTYYSVMWRYQLGDWPLWLFLWALVVAASAWVIWALSTDRG